MFIKIPFESEIVFKSNIKEITKMSLEHDYNITSDMVLGNFYISGEYKSHELSVNTEEFRYTLPFTVELSNKIKENTLEMNIEDFTYDIVNGNTLKVNIEYSLEGEIEEEEELFQSVNEDELDEEIKIIDDVLDSDEREEKEEDEIMEDTKKTIMETIKNEDDTFVTYHVHICKESDTFESISALYNVPVSLINEYNKIDTITSGDKILIPKYDE